MEEENEPTLQPGSSTAPAPRAGERDRAGARPPASDAVPPLPDGGGRMPGAAADRGRTAVPCGRGPTLPPDASRSRRERLGREPESREPVGRDPGSQPGGAG